MLPLRWETMNAPITVRREAETTTRLQNPSFSAVNCIEPWQAQSQPISGSALIAVEELANLSCERIGVDGFFDVSVAARRDRSLPVAHHREGSHGHNGHVVEIGISS